MRDVASQAAVEELLASRGIHDDTTVVLRGDKNNWFAAYAYWCLKLYGHADARLLDGGRQKWIEEGRELTREPSPAQRAVCAASPRDETIRARRDDVLAKLHSGVALVDVRSPAEHAGELIAPPGYEQEGAARGGHIPGAQSIPWALAVRDDGTFRGAEELRELYAARGITPEREVHVYCRIGERSAHTWFVLQELLGYPNARNDDGS